MDSGNNNLTFKSSRESLKSSDVKNSSSGILYCLVNVVQQGFIKVNFQERLGRKISCESGVESDFDFPKIVFFSMQERKRSNDSAEKFHGSLEPW